VIPILYLTFFFSGAAGLFYESIWTRYLGLFVGHDAYAQVLVLVIFLGGMALGALAVGRWSARTPDPLLGYAAVELAAGMIGLGFHGIYEAVTGFAYTTVFPAIGLGMLLLPVKWLTAAALILPQSVLLGASFPLMSAGILRRSPASPGRRLAMLYFTNSLGAAIGVLVAGFWLLELAGLPGTLVAASILNLSVGLVTFVVARRCPVAVAAVAVPVESAVGAPAEPGRIAPLLLAVSCGTAVASFVYEIGWLRMLSLVLGSATHSFELMLSAFILGLALGALWVRRRADRFANPLRALGLLQWVMGTAALATLLLYDSAFGWTAALMGVFARTEPGYAGFTVARYGICLAIMLPATFCAGTTLPLITRTLLAAGWGERAIGAVYGVNTLGSIVGAALAGLALLPVLGLKHMLMLGAGADLALGVWILAVASRGRAGAWRPAAAAVLAGLALLGAERGARFDRSLLDSGVFRGGTLRHAGASQVLFYRDGRTASVAVRRITDDGYLSISTNGKPDASLSAEWFGRCEPGTSRRPLRGDASTQLLAPMLTLAYMADARTAAVIGHGSGMSSHFLLSSPRLRRVVTIEIEPAMIAGSRLFYPANRRVFDDPRSAFVLDDARSFLAAAGGAFDLIMSEPSNPWVSGVSGLFTREFYRRVVEHLTPNGVFGQWIHLYEINDRLVLSVLGALHENFRSYAIHITSGGDMLVVGSNRPVLGAPDWSVFTAPAMEADLCHFLPLTPAMLQATRLADRDALAPLLDRSEAANSDYYPVLDLGTEKSRFLVQRAAGFGGLFAGPFDLTAPFGGRRVGPAGDSRAPVPEIPRMRLLAIASSLRAGPDAPGSGAPDSQAVAAVNRQRQWSALRSGAVTPAAWQPWLGELLAAERDLHGGTSGFADETFYRATFGYLERSRAPAEVVEAVRFWHGLRSWSFAEAAQAADTLVAATVARRPWLDPDELREGAVVAKLRTGDIAGARRVFEQLAPLARRGAEDVRTQLLYAYIREAERGARPANLGLSAAVAH
jgi:spermidine synthase